MTFPSSLKAVLLGSLISLFALLGLECIARIGSTAYEDAKSLTAGPPIQGLILSAESGWEPKPGFSGMVYGTTERQYDQRGFLSSDASKVSNHSTPKVLFLGDACTLGWAIPVKATFAERIEALLPGVNTVNLGVMSYTSLQGYRMLAKRGLEVYPDIVVVSFNYNDRRYVLSSEQADSDERFRRMYGQHRVRRLLGYLYLFRSVEFLLGKTGITSKDAESSVTDRPVNVDRLMPRVSPENYEKNLINIVELAKSKRMDVIFLLLKDNPAKTRHLARGVESLESKEYDRAIEFLTTGVRERNQFSALSQFYLAKAYRGKGLTEMADKFSILKKPSMGFDGGDPIYLDTPYNEIMKKVAKQYGVELVDAGDALDRHSSYYLDRCHPDENGHKEIAALLAKTIRKVLLDRDRLPSASRSAG